MRIVLGFVATLLAVTTANAATTATPAAPRLSAPSEFGTAAALPPISYPQALILIRSALAALQQADETENYTTLQALGDESFRTNNSPAKLAQEFAALRPFNIMGVLILEPRFTQLPVVHGGNLQMAGMFANAGYNINFQLAYGAQNGRWRLSQINVGIQSER